MIEIAPVESRRDRAAPIEDALGLEQTNIVPAGMRKQRGVLDLWNDL